MAIRQIRKDGDEILRKKSKVVDVVDDKIREILNDMEETMHAANGVGISAVQVGILKRLVVIDIYDGNKPLKLVNPVIIKQKGKQEVEEGCLSFPNQFAKVIRPMEITIKALDEFGKEITVAGYLEQDVVDYCEQLGVDNCNIHYDLIPEVFKNIPNPEKFPIQYRTMKDRYNRKKKESQRKIETKGDKENGTER